SPVFDADLNSRWWQGQVSETHTFGSTAASQFLLAGSYSPFIYRMKDPTRALRAFPTVLNFYVPGTFTNIGRGDFINAFGSSGSLTRYQLSDDLAKTWGQQKFGFGANFERTYWTYLQYTANI